MDTALNMAVASAAASLLADTEDWRVHLCIECLSHFRNGPYVEKLIDAAYEAGRQSVIGSPLEPDDEVENGR